MEEKPIRWIISYTHKRAQRNIKVFQFNYEPKNKVLLMEFSVPQYPNSEWRAWAIGINFTREDLRDAHLFGCAYKWVNVKNFMTRKEGE